jgi:hypothetical protein
MTPGYTENFHSYENTKYCNHVDGGSKFLRTAGTDLPVYTDSAARSSSVPQPSVAMLLLIDCGNLAKFSDVVWFRNTSVSEEPDISVATQVAVTGPPVAQVAAVEHGDRR